MSAIFESLIFIPLDGRGSTFAMDAPLAAPLSWPLSDDAYKAAKIGFVSDMRGTTIAEIAAVTLMTPVSFFTHSLLTHYIDARQAAPTHWTRSTAFAFASHLILVEGSVLLSMTVMAHRLVELYAAHALVILTCLLLSFIDPQIGIRSLVSPLGEHSSAALRALSSSRKPFLSVYRAQMMMSTVVAILAVDFYVFPRRFAKTEEFGFGLMDVGVGSFILSHAMVSPMARALSGSSALDGALRAKKTDDPRAAPVSGGRSWARMLLKVAQNVSPMLLMGSARFFMIRTTNYQEHVTEYGVHWNFFFTLAVVALLSTLISVRPPLAGALGTILIVGYQFSLQHLGLERYILHAPRVDFVSANKEGICSAVGYFALYLFGVELGHMLNTTGQAAVAQTAASATEDEKDAAARRGAVAHWWRKLTMLGALSALLLAATLGAHYWIAPCSRRMVCRLF
jgi:phosphatidylinositol glycan class W